MTAAVRQERMEIMKYKQNETMIMLGRQCILPLFCRKEIAKQYKEVFETIKKESPLMDSGECIDLFMLGYIWGKRDERARRKQEL